MRDREVGESLGDHVRTSIEMCASNLDLLWFVILTIINYANPVVVAGINS